MTKEAMECEVTEVHTDTVARVKDILLTQEQFQHLGTLFKMFSDPTENTECAVSGRIMCM